MPEIDKPLLAHLLRRAGFGATFQELDRYSQLSYEAVVDQLLHPELQPAIEEDVLERYYIDWKESRNIEGALTESVYRMNAYAGGRPLQEKIALFWHGVFATGLAKVLHEKTMLNQIDLFREQGLGNFRELLVGLAKDPAMIFWLDNNFNHKDAPNENWGRELLELFSLGVGMDGQENFTEGDVQSAARAFTGWTIDDDNVTSFPFGKLPWRFRYLPDDHDEEEKTFLGHTGNFNGEDIIEIVLQQEACSKFIARHLYNFFVADEPQVPAWNIEEPRNPAAIEMMAKILVENDYEVKPVLRAMFNSDFFKEALNQKVKSPVEVVIGTLRGTGDLTGSDPKLEALGKEPGYLGQDILDPPSVEGWHTGREWINSGSLVKRVNFVSDRVSDTSLPGVQRMVEHVGNNGATMSADELVDRCLDIMGPVEVSDLTKNELVSNVESGGEIELGGESFSRRTSETFALIAATREFQFG